MGGIALSGSFYFMLGIVLQYMWIKCQRKLHLAQVQKSYGTGIDVDIKGITPTMGGVVFVVLALLSLLCNYSYEALLFWALPLSCSAIGFMDDWLKFSRKSSEGLRSLCKLMVQIVISFIWVLWAFCTNGLSLWPGLYSPVWLAVPFTFLSVVTAMNAVNITDGLDGLAGGAFIISLSLLGYLMPDNAVNIRFMVILFAIAASFMLFNVRPALTFMGDTGSHFLGGALVALCVQGGIILAVLPAAFLFGFEMLSSAIQIVAIRKFKTKVFRMAPLHHHFQLLGWDETTVTMRFLIIHAVGAYLLAALFVQNLGL